MRIYRRIFHKRMLHGVAAAAMCCACASYGASAVLSGLELVGGGKGVALTLKADAPFPLKIEETVSAKNPQQAVLSIHCTGVIYGLEEFEFTSFPPACPVKRIAVSESPAGNSIDMLCVLTKGINRPVLSKQKESRWIILLSRAPVADFSWSATPQAKGAPAAQQPKPQLSSAGMSHLKDITLLHRDRVELLTFVFDGPTTMRLKRSEDKVIVLFVNATSGLPATRFSPPGDPLTVVELKQMTHGGTMWLGASITMRKEALAGALMQAFSDRLVIYRVNDSLQRLSLWSAAGGEGMAYNFIKIPHFEVDYKGMEKKALTDLSSDMRMGKTFAIREEEPKKAGSAAGAAAQAAAPVPEKGKAAVAAPEKEKVTAASAAAPSVKNAPAVIRLIVTKNNVSLRSAPSRRGSTVAKLTLGTVATLVEKKKEWVKIKTADAEGWVSSSVVADSAKAAQSVFDNIEKLNQQRLALQKAAEEKSAREQAAKEKAEQEKLAKQKLAQEQAAQKKASLEAKAATRDSTLRYAAAVEESVQTAKTFHAKKLVEYHAYGRDPFLPLSQDEEGAVPNVENMNLVGILYDAADRIALFEGNNGKSYVLRENDPVQNGYLLRVQPDKVLFLLNELGISRTYALKLNKGKLQ